MEHVRRARDVAKRLLAEPLPVRWSHTEGVGRAAESIARIVEADAERLVCAAWLHDIGYSPAIAKTGFHPLDGARYLRDVLGADSRLCRLVANHSFSLIEARNRGLAGDLTTEFPEVEGLTNDALTYCDMTTSPHGDKVTVETRLDEIAMRYGMGDIVATSIYEARPRIVKSVRAVNALLDSAT